MAAPADHFDEARETRRPGGRGPIIVSVVWLLVFGIYVFSFMGLDELLSLLPYEFASLISAALIPVVLILVSAAALSRMRRDHVTQTAVRQYLENLQLPDRDVENRIRELTAGLQRVSQSVEAEMSAALARAELLDQSLSQQATGLQNVAVRAAEHSQQVEGAVRQRVQEIDTLVQHLDARSNQMTGHAEYQSELLNNASGDAASRLAEIDEQLAELTAKLSVSMQDATTQATNIADLIGQPASDLRQVVEQSADRAAAVSGDMQRQGEQLQALMTSVKAAAAEAGGAVEKANVALRRNVAATFKESNNLAEMSQQHVSALEKAVTATAAEVDKLGPSAARKVAEFARATDELKVSAGEAEQAITGATGSLQAEANQIAGAMESVSDQFRGVEEQAGQSLTAASQIADGFSDIQTELAAAAGAIEASRENAQTRAAEITAFMDETVQRADQRLSQVVRRAEEAVNVSSEHIGGIADRLSEVGRTAEKESTRMAGQANELADQGRRVGDVIAARSAEFSLLAGDIENAARNALQSIGDSQNIARGIASAMGSVAGELEAATHRVGEGADQAVDRMNAARDNAGAAMQRLHEQAADMLSVLEEHAGTLTRTGQQISEAADFADGNMRENLAQVTANVARAVAEAQGAVTEIERAGVVMAEATEVSRTNITETISALENRSEDVSERVTGKTEQLAERTAEVGLLLQDLESATENSLRAMTGLTGETRTLMASLGESSHQVVDAAEQLSVRSGRSAADLQQVADRITGTAAEVSGQFQGLQGTFETQAELLDSVVSRLTIAADRSEQDVAHRLNTLADRVETAQDTARELVVSFETGAEQMLLRANEARGKVDQMVADIGARAEDAMVEANAAGDKLAARVVDINNMTSDLRNAVTLAVSEFDGIAKGSGEAAGRLQDGARAMEDAIAGVENRIGRAVMMMRGENSTLTENGAAVAEQLDLSAARVAEQGAQLLNLADDVRGLADNADEVLSGRLQASAENLQLVTAQSRSLVGEIRQASDELRTAGSATEGQMAALATHIGRSVEELGEVSSTTVDNMRIAAGDIDRESAGLREVAVEVSGQLNQATGQMDGVLTRVTENVEKAEVRLQSLSNLMQGTGEQVRRTSADSADAARHAQEQLQMAVKHAGEAQRETENLMNSTDRARSMAEDAVTEMTGTLSRFGGVADNVTEKAGQLVEQANTGAARLTRLFQDASTELKSFTEGEEGAAERVRATSAELGERITAFTDQAASMEIAGDSIARQLEERLTALGQAENAAIRVTAELSAGLEQATGSLNDMIRRGGASRDELNDKVRETLTEFTELSSRVDRHLTDLQDGIGKARENSEQAVGTMKEVREEMRIGAQQFEQAAVKLSESATHQREAYQSVLEEGRATTKAAAENLAVQASAIASASQAATVQSGLAARAFEGQADKLIKASESAARAAVTMRDKSASDREAQFLDAAGSVMSGLNDLSVEIASQLDNRRDERLWRQFLKGEGGIFARHVVASSDRRQIADRHKKDDVFRQHVDNYLGEFEALIKRVDGTGGNSALTAALITADVGKLYLALCDALGRKPLRVDPFA